MRQGQTDEHVHTQIDVYKQTGKHTQTITDRQTKTQTDRQTDKLID